MRGIRVAVVRVVGSVGDGTLSSSEKVVETIHSVNVSLELHVILHSARVDVIFGVLVEFLQIDASHGQVMMAFLKET